MKKDPHQGSSSESQRSRRHLESFPERTIISCDKDLEPRADFIELLNSNMGPVPAGALPSTF